LSNSLERYLLTGFQEIAIYDNNVAWVEFSDGEYSIFLYDNNEEWEIFGIKAWILFSIITIMFLVVIITFLFRRKRKKAKLKKHKQQEQTNPSTTTKPSMSHILECPSCNEAFKPPPEVKELVCPHCGAKGEID